jgi:hypothetical protein
MPGRKIVPKEMRSEVVSHNACLHKLIEDLNYMKSAVKSYAEKTGMHGEYLDTYYTPLYTGFIYACEQMVIANNELYGFLTIFNGFIEIDEDEEMGRIFDVFESLTCELHDIALGLFAQVEAVQEKLAEVAFDEAEMKYIIPAELDIEIEKLKQMQIDIYETALADALGLLKNEDGSFNWEAIDDWKHTDPIHLMVEQKDALEMVLKEIEEAGV